jgi:thiamine pyrophosphate-dependent acetolactate synthase large subunit-like protein
MGVPGRRAKTAEELAKAIENGLNSGGPNLIQVDL